MAMALARCVDCISATPSPAAAALTTSRSSSQAVVKGLVSDETLEIMQIIDFVFLLGLVSLFGIGTNIINIIVFFKQGFKDTMTVSLLGLAVGDLSCLLTMFWTGICFNPFFIHSEVHFNVLDLMYLSGGWPHVVFNRITSIITVFITLERCLCIIFPLKVKTLITPRRTKIINIAIFAFMLGINVPFYYANRLDWAFDETRNRSLLTLAFSENREEIEIIVFHAQSAPLSSATLFIVIVCTTRLVVKLNEKAKWRQASTSKHSSVQERTAAKEQKVVKMVTLISTVFIICFLPGTLLLFTMGYTNEFGWTGRYRNLFILCWSVTIVLEAVNSSVNIFIYFTMSSKFKATLLRLFCGAAAAIMAE